MKLRCANCGKIIETIPLTCGLSISLNSSANKWECDFGECGVRDIKELLCTNCCSNLA
ncbi:MAG: hypothetical protein ACQERB_11450 [Promethearchaeati archaeon]